MYNKNDTSRAYVLLFIAGIMCLLCVLKLFQLQIIEGKRYREEAEQKKYLTMTVEAPRGEILDRYGNVLVGNRTCFSVQIKPSGLSSDERADVIARVIRLIDKEGGTVRDSLPITKEAPFSFTMTGKGAKKRLKEWKAEYGIDPNATAQEAILFLADKYDVKPGLSLDLKRKTVGVIYEIRLRGYSEENPYTIASDVSMNTVAIVKENNWEYPSIVVAQEQIRYYPNQELAAHILGNVGLIYQEEYEKLKDEGYSMDAIIGKQGIEYTYESDLRGFDGMRSVARMSGEGEQIVESREPIPGNEVLLTLDVEVQSVMEKTLKATIESAQQSGYIDCNAGSAVCLDVNSGEILAITSYPGFNPAEYNAKYEEFLNNPANPLWNRALAGTYSPGSTFKPLTAIAALEEDKIEADDLIEDKGKYTYYKDYQPSCLEWRNTGEGHGYVNTALALQDSCNYYFFEVGRRLGIDSLADYAKRFGLGQITGIEIGGEAEGLVASREAREANDGIWYAGDTLQAAIGQSDNLFTPIQMANYTATIANGGTRYRPHLLKAVKKTGTGEILRQTSIEVVDKIDISDENLNAVKNGMKKVTEEGTAKSVFKDFEIAVGGKTGTAEVLNGSSNGIFIAFAPFDKPEIAIAIVLDHGGHGSTAAPIARAVFETYFENQKVSDTYEPHMLLQ
ncbi:MAG: hypothetical protein IJE10_08015 [Clostridia bacterium]|nr:hypothetical protein [Clostridia bacterium]